MMTQFRWRLIFLFGACWMAWCPAAQGQLSSNHSSQSLVAQTSQQTRLHQTNSSLSDPGSSESLTLFPHSKTSRFWISGQANIVLQWHPSFPAKYSGPNSLRPQAESAVTRVFTLYTGYELTRNTEVFLDIEDSGGNGISNTLGLAGFTDLDAVRVGVNEKPYVARAMIREVIPLSAETESERREATSFTLANSVPVRRIELRAGKFSLVDFFDTNTYGSDSHLQFLNWAVDNDAAYDYAANTRGYTDAAMVEYDDGGFSARFAEALMPEVANGIHLDADLARARAENWEFDFTGNTIGGRPGAVRLLAYLNHADMGNYEQAISEYLHGQTPTSEITATRRQGRRKYGFGLNFEQELPGDVAVFGRLGWSDGQNESFVYTECNRTAELGGFAMGTRWHRVNDRAGVAFAANGLTAAHREYLALGGLGFQLGDGGLDYGLEKIVEAFYTFHLWSGFYASADLQHINNPGYNMARGPVLVPGLRLHVDF